MVATDRPKRSPERSSSPPSRRPSRPVPSCRSTAGCHRSPPRRRPPTRERVARISSSKVQVAPPSRELSPRQRKESGVMSVKRQRSWGSSSSLRKHDVAFGGPADEAPDAAVDRLDPGGAPGVDGGVVEADRRAVEGQRRSAFAGLTPAGDDPDVLYGAATEDPAEVQLSGHGGGAPVGVGPGPLEVPGADELAEQAQLVGERAVRAGDVQRLDEPVGGGGGSAGHGRAPSSVSVGPKLQTQLAAHPVSRLRIASATGRVPRTSETWVGLPRKTSSSTSTPRRSRPCRHSILERHVYAGWVRSAPIGGTIAPRRPGRGARRVGRSGRCGGLVVDGIRPARARTPGLAITART